MIELGAHLQLRELLSQEKRFPLGVELVSTRGMMTETQALKVRRYAEDLTHSPLVDWVSITDNAGGNPQMAPMALGTPILYGGKEVVVHLTCKDLNRHSLESLLWMYASQGFQNILALTGDYPVAGPEGMAKPVFDIDSVGLLHLIQRMNNGLEVSQGSSRKSVRKLRNTIFCSGAVCSPYKQMENTLMPQYFKLEKKIQNGADFIIPQIGYDTRKAAELLCYLRSRNLSHVPVIGNVYVLNPYVLRLFHAEKIPGVVVTDELYDLCLRQTASPDKGHAFFEELAAKQIAVYRGLGYHGIYLGGVHHHDQIESLLDRVRSFANEDWKIFSREIRFSSRGEYYAFGVNEETELPDITCPTPRTAPSGRTLSYQISTGIHQLAFENGKGCTSFAKRLCKNGSSKTQPPVWLRGLEQLSKRLLYKCQDCGDCSLAETAFLCPESQCAKNQRNGPCGGAKAGRCEVLDIPCIWARAYDRRKADAQEEHLLDFVPVFQDQALRGTSAWANYWHEIDHIGKKPFQTKYSTLPRSPSHDERK